MDVFIRTQITIEVGVYANVEPGMDGDLIDPPQGPFVEITDVVGLRGKGKLFELNLLPLIGEKERELVTDLVREEVEYHGAGL